MSMFDPELEEFGELDSEEEFRGRRSYGRPPSRALRYRPRPLPTKRPLRSRRVMGRGWGQPAPYPEDLGEPVPARSERVRWLQFCLNRAMRAELPIDGIISPAMRSVIRTFQRQQGLPVSGIAGPDTEEALKAACRDQDSGAVGRVAAPSSEPDSEIAVANEVSRVLNQAGLSQVKFVRAGTLATVDSLPEKPGLYWVTAPGKSRHFGKANNLRRRLLQHRLCATTLGVQPGAYRVFIGMTGYGGDKLRSLEQKANRTLIDKKLVRGLRAELEEESWEL